MKLFKKCLLLVVPAVMLTLTGCPAKEVLWIENGSTVKHLVFHLNEKQRRGRMLPMYRLQIERCGEDASGSDTVAVIDWTSTGIPPAAIRLNSPPAGYSVLRGSSALAPGCYAASALPGGNMRFVVRPDGSIGEPSE